MSKINKNLYVFIAMFSISIISCKNERIENSNIILEFFDYFNQHENIKIVNLNPIFYKNLVSEENEFHSMMDNISDMKLMVAKKDIAEYLIIKEKLISTTQKGNFKKILEVENNHGTKISGFMRKKSKYQKDFICEVNENDLYIVLSLSGKINEGKLLEIVQDPSLKTFGRSSYLRF